MSWVVIMSTIGAITGLINACINIGKTRWWMTFTGILPTTGLTVIADVMSSQDAFDLGRSQMPPMPHTFIIFLDFTNHRVVPINMVTWYYLKDCQKVTLGTGLMNYLPKQLKPQDVLNAKLHMGLSGLQTFFNILSDCDHIGFITADGEIIKLSPHHHDLLASRIKKILDTHGGSTLHSPWVE